MAILTLADEAAAARWVEIEQHTPAGLVPASLAQVDSIATAPADLFRSRLTKGRSNNVVYLVIP
jgi:hypothetical protein